MRVRSVVVASLCVLVGACAALPERAPDPRLVQVQSVAGQRVGTIHYMSRLYSWEAIDDQHVLLYTRPREAYLLEVVPCPGLESAVALGVTSRFNSVTSGIDSVVTGWQRPMSFPCRIQSIRPIDVKALRAAEKEADKAVPENEVKVLPRAEEGKQDGADKP